MNSIKALVAGISLFSGMLFAPGVAGATGTTNKGCTDIPDPYSGNYYQMQKYFSVSFSRNGDVGTAKISLNKGVTLCSDVPMIVQSFSMGPNWNGKPDSRESFISSLPQTMYRATHFTFSKTDTSKTVTVAAPHACYGTQLDAYVGEKEVTEIKTEHQGETQEFGGKIFTPTEKCEEPKPETIKVCELATNKIITINKEDYNSKKHGDVKDCEKVTVCDTTTRQIVTIAKHELTDKHTTDMAKCKIEVCRLSDKQMVTIKYEDYQNNKDKYSQDANDCAETPVVELPDTGIGATISSAFGLGTLILTSYYYMRSRG